MTRPRNLKLRQYSTCVKELQKVHGLSRREISELIGIHEAVMSRRMSGKQEPTREALIVINTLADVYNGNVGRWVEKVSPHACLAA